MFTDKPTIPAQLETLLDLVHEMAERKATDDSLRQMLQPQGLKDLREASAQADNHLFAARELNLTRYDDEKNVRLSYRVRGQHQAKQHIVAAFERVALGDAQVENWAGRFYAFLIAVEDGGVRRTPVEAEKLTRQFMGNLPAHVSRDNPMNLEKFRALMRWYSYVGLGWVDPADSFVPDPTPRLRRALPAIWRDDDQLDAANFVERLSRTCPELDGGELFGEGVAAADAPPARECTRALATALWRLHDEGAIHLRCPADSRGWGLQRAGGGAVTGEASNRFDSVARRVQS